MEYPKKYNDSKLAFILMIGSMMTLGCNKLHGQLGMTHNGDIEAEAESTISALTMATQAEANTDGIDSDEEAEQQISRMQSDIASKGENITEKVAEINDKEENKAVLLASNGVMLHNINEKNTDTDDTNRTLEQSILEIEGSYITVNCIACHQPVRCTHNMLRTLLDKYNPGYTYGTAFSDKIYSGYPHKEFNLEKDSVITTIFIRFLHRILRGGRKFDRCFRCMNQLDVDELQRTINENTEEIARLEPEIRQEQLLVDLLRYEERNSAENLQAYQRQSAKRMQERAEKEAERAEKEAAQARIVELESQLAMRSNGREQDPITMLAYEALSLVRAGADVEVSLNTAGLTQENRVAVEERIQAPMNEDGVHSFSVTAARGSEGSTEQQADSVAQNRVITIRQSARAQHNNRDIQPVQEERERERRIALNLLRANLPIALISSTTGLSVEEVEDLQRAETIEQITSEIDDMTIIDSIAEEGAINRSEREEASFNDDGVTIVPSITEEDLASIERRLSMNE